MNIQKIIANSEKVGIKLIDDTKFQHYSRDGKNIKNIFRNEAEFIDNLIVRSEAKANMNKALLHIKNLKK